ncbi:MAG TPA: hypothetical protein PKE16_08750 [Hyphomicrobium sp.]|nr:hypothetical protein [Hyphomicrobium sp.]
MSARASASASLRRARGIRDKHQFGVGEIAEKAKRVDDTPYHGVKIWSLVAPQEIGQIGDVVFLFAGDARGKIGIVEGVAAVPEFEYRDGADEFARGYFRKIMQIANFGALTGCAIRCGPISSRGLL